MPRTKHLFLSVAAFFIAGTAFSVSLLTSSHPAPETMPAAAKFSDPASSYEVVAPSSRNAERNMGREAFIAKVRTALLRETPVPLPPATPEPAPTLGEQSFGDASVQGESIDFAPVGSSTQSGV